MGLPQQTVALLQATAHLVQTLRVDAVLVLTETYLDWTAVRAKLPPCKLLAASPQRAIAQRLHDVPEVTVIDLDPDPAPTKELMSSALLRAIAAEEVQPGAHVVVLYNGIASGEVDRPEPIDSLSVLHLNEHLERLTAADLRRLNTRIPLEVLRLVVDLATDIGREGREGKKVGTLFVVGDSRKVLSMCSAINFNPFRGYSISERNLRDRQVREQIKDICQMDGAIIVSRNGIAQAACVNIDVPADGIVLAKGLGTRHVTAAAISRKTQAIAVVVSQSSGAVRLFQDGEVALHIEPLARPHIWQAPRLETDEEQDEE
jgi:DNA integrity scanning protein DisA with diadenylate cyclase activity